jgi:hypothetical protein
MTQVCAKMEQETQTAETVPLLVDGVPHEVEFSLGGKKAFVLFEYPDGTSSPFVNGITVERDTPEKTRARIEALIRNHRTSIDPRSKLFKKIDALNKSPEEKVKKFMPNLADPEKE